MLTLKGSLTRHDAASAAHKLEALLAPQATIELDLSGITAIDSVGVALVAQFLYRARALGCILRIQQPHPQVVQTLSLFPFVPTEEAKPPERISLTERWGVWALLAWEISCEFLMLCADTFWFTLEGMRRRRRIRWQAVGIDMALMGADALPVVGLIAFLVGGTVALQSAAQLRNFGANLFVADLMGVSITRELGPLITAIVVAGRSGSAIAAEVATMIITEEIDALRTMGLHPVRFLMVPKILALNTTLPLLTTLANVLAISGGFGVAVLYLDISPSVFLERLQQSVYIKDILTGLFKSLLFANLIVTIGALCGFRTHGGADAVGRSTTTSVVASVFAIIAVDAACSLLFYFHA